MSGMAKNVAEKSLVTQIATETLGGIRVSHNMTIVMPVAAK